MVEKGKIKVVSTINDKPIWDLMKEYINEFPLGDIISRSTLISSIYQIKKSYIYLPTVDNYIYHLKAVNVLEALGSGKYKKLRGIPITLTTSQLKKISNKNSWESWFMSIDYV
jgi:hypothetical protein